MNYLAAIIKELFFAVAVLASCGVQVGLAQESVVNKQSDPETFGQIPGENSISTFLQGIVKPSKNAVLRFSAPGIISKVHVSDGDFVSSGDSLLTTDNRLEQAAVRMAEIDAHKNADLKKAKLDYELARSRYLRTKKALAKGASNETEMIEKKHALEAAELTYKKFAEDQKRLEVQLEIAKVNLANKTLTAPFDGQVIRVHHKLGNSVDFSTAAVVCADLSKLSVDMNLPSKFYGKLEEGSKRQLFAMSPVAQKIQATIVHVSSEIEPSSRTFRVTFEIENQDLSLPSGFEVWFAKPDKSEFFANTP